MTPTPPPSSPPGDGFVFPLHTNSRSHTRQNCLTRSCVSTTDTCSSNRTQFSSPHIISSLHGRHSDTTSAEFHGQSTLNRFGCLWSSGSCNEHSVGSPIDRHSATCRAIPPLSRSCTLHLSTSLRGAVVFWTLATYMYSPVQATNMTGANRRDHLANDTLGNPAERSLPVRPLPMCEGYERGV